MCPAPNSDESGYTSVQPARGLMCGQDGAVFRAEAGAELQARLRRDAGFAGRSCAINDLAAILRAVENESGERSGVSPPIPRFCTGKLTHAARQLSFS
jgi:hypothetical protein